MLEKVFVCLPLIRTAGVRLQVAMAFGSASPPSTIDSWDRSNWDLIAMFREGIYESLSNLDQNRGYSNQQSQMHGLGFLFA